MRGLLIMLRLLFIITDLIIHLIIAAIPIKNEARIMECEL